MKSKYSKDILDMQLDIAMTDGIKPVRTFFSITEDDLENVFHVKPTDSFEEAQKKIIAVVSTDEFLLKYFNKDPRKWQIASFEPGYWTTTVKEDKIYSKEELMELGYASEEITKPVRGTTKATTLQQKLTVKFTQRKPENAITDESFFKEYEKEFKEFLEHDNVFTMILKNALDAVQPPKKNTKQKYDPEKLLVIPDVELHIGKLASKFDSTDSYDYKKALYRYIKIILEAEKVQDTYHAKEICMTIGNDFFNTDTEQNTTTAGTEQHNDTRFQQMISTGIVAHVWAIERMKKNCEKLIIKFNPGNHDFLTDYCLYMQLCDKYRNDPKVEISSEVKDLRFATSLVWHENLIIFCHGKGPDGKPLNDDRLAELRDNTFRNEAKLVDYTTVLAGHLHNATENNFSKRKKSSNGVTVLRNGSPSGDGAWDAQNGYSADKTHQVYLFDANRGLSATFNLQLTKKELEKGISIGGITDNTDYLKAVETSIATHSDSILEDDIKRIYAENERVIKEINKKYEKKLKQLGIILENPTLTDEQRRNILITIGYEEEVKPYLEKRELLQKALNSPTKKLKLV